MTEKFEHDKNDLKAAVIEMGDLAKDMLRDSVKALKGQDVELARKVMDQKRALADMDAKIEENALMVLMLYQPMASDMRLLGTILKIITYLMRIGRYGKDIAKVAIEMSSEPHVKKLVSIPQIARIACGMIDDVQEAFSTGSISKLGDFSERDDEADEIRYSIFRECLTYMMEDPKTITRCAHYIMIARYLERCADHACKIAEKVHYMVTGEHIEIK